MPKAYERCVRKLRKKGYSKRRAHATCTKANAGNVKEYRRKKKAKREKKDAFLAAQRSGVRS